MVGGRLRKMHCVSLKQHIKFVFMVVFAGWFAGLPAGWLSGWFAGRFAGWLADWLACLPAGWLACWLACFLAGWLAWLLAGLLADWLDGLLAGLLAGRRPKTEDRRSKTEGLGPKT